MSEGGQQVEGTQARSSLPGFDAHFSTYIEPPIRLPRGLGTPSAHSDRLAIGAAASVALGTLGWLVGAPASAFGPAYLLGAGLVLGALQLRMGGQGMTLRDARDHAVASAAGFLGLDYAREMSSESLQEMLQGAGAVQPSSLMQRTDQVRGDVGGVRYTAVQVSGAVRPVPSDGQWFGLDIGLLTERYAVDGLLARFDLPAPLARLPITVSNDRRLAFRDRDRAPLPVLVPPRSGDGAFDGEFRVHGAWDERMGTLLRPPLCAELLALSATLGPLTFYAHGARAHLCVWSIGDLYELSSLGSGLRGQCEHIALALGAPSRFAAALAALSASAEGRAHGPGEANSDSSPRSQ